MIVEPKSQVNSKQHSNRRWLIPAYVAALHCLLLFILMNSNFIAKVSSHNPLTRSDISAHYKTMRPYHRLIDSTVLPSSNLFFGDSITQSLSVSALSGRNVNFGIGRDTTVGLLKRLPTHSSLQHARVVVLAIGINDLWRRGVQETSDNYAAILQKIPGTTPVIINAVFPVDPFTLKSPLNHQLVHELNKELERLSQSRDNTAFLDLTPEFSDAEGALKSELHVGDGLHINTAGYKIWLAKLDSVLSQIECKKTDPILPSITGSSCYIN